MYRRLTQSMVPGLNSMSTNCNQLMEWQWHHLGVSRTTNLTCMSTGHFSAGDQNCKSETSMTMSVSTAGRRTRYLGVAAKALGVVQWFKLIGLPGMTREELSR